MARLCTFKMYSARTMSCQCFSLLEKPPPCTRPVMNSQFVNVLFECCFILVSVPCGLSRFVKLCVHDVHHTTKMLRNALMDKMDYMCMQLRCAICQSIICALSWLVWTSMPCCAGTKSWLQVYVCVCVCVFMICPSCFACVVSQRNNALLCSTASTTAACSTMRLTPCARVCASHTSR